ncbi:hypothetical protein ACF0H5_012642 [Mactra antiquata]
MARGENFIVMYNKGKTEEEALKLPWYGRWGNLVIITFIFILLALGLTMLILGIVMTFVHTQMKQPEVTSFFNKIIFNGYLKVGDVTNSLPFFSISVGLCIVLFTIVGCVARSKKSRVLLTVFTILLIWFLIVQILSSVMWIMVREKFTTGNVKDEMNRMFLLYNGTTSTNEISNSLDYIFIKYECCGVDSMTSSSNSYQFNSTLWWTNRDSNLTLVPSSCCRHVTMDTYLTYSNTDCMRILLSHHSKGCYDAVVDWLNYFWTPTIVLSNIMIVIEVILILFSCVLCCAVRHAKEIRI